MEATPIRRVPQSGPDVWLGTAMVARDDWIHMLSAEEIEDLRRAIRTARETHADMLAVTAEQFPLPVLTRRLKAISHALEHGCGMATIRGIPAGAISMDDLRWALWGIGAHLGTAVSQNKSGEYFAEVRDYGEVLGRPDSRGYRTASSLRFHTDRCDVVALLCARQCKQGGDSLIVSTPAIHNAMLERRPDLLAELFGARRGDAGQQAARRPAMARGAGNRLKRIGPQRGKHSARDLAVLRAGAGAHADPADAGAAEQDRKTALQVGQLALGGRREVEFQFRIEPAGRLAVGGRRHRLLLRGHGREGFRAVHAHETEQVAPVVDDCDVLRRAERFRLFHAGFQRVHHAFVGQVQARTGKRHGYSLTP